MKKYLGIILITLSMLALLCGCAKETPAEEYPDITASVSQNAKFHSVVVSLSQKDLEAAGFALGDSCDIEFSNGYCIEAVPFYSGYYVKNGDPVIVAYPGDSNLYITYNNLGMWDQAGLQEGDSVTIYLCEHGAYQATQESLAQEYSFVRTDYESDEQFCNFRALSGGNLKENFLFRGASPVDNSRGRAAYTDALLQAQGIQKIIDLADDNSDMQTYLASSDFASSYAKALYEKGDVALLDMGSSYESNEYQKKVVDGLRQMMTSTGPVYIHCMEGKDRTGFVCFVLEALAGASYQEMLADYMTTYANYFRILQKETPDKYQAVASLYFDSFIEYFCSIDHEELESLPNYQQAAINYLRAGGMTDNEIEQLRAFITKG